MGIQVICHLKQNKCMYTCIYVCAHARYIYMCMYMYVLTFACMCLCTCYTHTYVLIVACMCSYTCYTHRHVYVLMVACMCRCLCRGKRAASGSIPLGASHLLWRQDFSLTQNLEFPASDPFPPCFRSQCGQDEECKSPWQRFVVVPVRTQFSLS